MLILIGLIVLFILGSLIKKKYGYRFDWETIGEMMMMTSTICLAVCLIMWPICLSSDKAFIRQVEITRDTIAEARINGNKIELAALQTEIIETNKLIIGKQYWNETIWGLWTHDDVMNLELLK